MYIYIYTVAVLAAKIPSNMCNIGFEKRDMAQKRPIFEGRPCSLVSINKQDPVASHVRSHSVKLQVVEFAVWKGKHWAAVVRTEAFFDDSSATGDRYGSVAWLPVQPVSTYGARLPNQSFTIWLWLTVCELERSTHF